MFIVHRKHQSFQAENPRDKVWDVLVDVLQNCSQTAKVLCCCNALRPNASRRQITYSRMQQPAFKEVVANVCSSTKLASSSPLFMLAQSSKLIVWQR